MHCSCGIRTVLKQNLCLSGLIWYLGALCSQVFQHRPQWYRLTIAVRMLLALARDGWAWIVLPASGEAAAATMLVCRDSDHGQLCAEQLLSTLRLSVQECFYKPDYHPSSCMLARVAWNQKLVRWLLLLCIQPTLGKGTEKLQSYFLLTHLAQSLMSFPKGIKRAAILATASAFTISLQDLILGSLPTFPLNHTQSKTLLFWPQLYNGPFLVRKVLSPLPTTPAVYSKHYRKA